MNEEIELSIIVAIYNEEEYIEKCVRSILQQTYQVGEIICVDDGSTDNGMHVLQKLAKENSIIKVIHKENGGLVSARKAGLSVAKGKYIAYVDGDDWIEKNMYEEMMNELLRYDADIVTSGIIRDYATHCVPYNEGIQSGVYEGENLLNKVWLKMIEIDKFYKSNIFMHIYNKIYRRDLLEKNQFRVSDSISVGEDANCVYPCILDAKRIVVTGKNFYHYCIRENSIMGQKRNNEWEMCQIAFDELKEKMELYSKKVPNIMKQFEVLKLYMLMLRCPEKIITLKNDFLYPYGKIKPQDKIIIYGKGRFGKELNQLFKREKYCEVVNWIDKKTLAGEKSIDYLKNIQFDKIIIAVMIYDFAIEIYNELIKSISPEKILMITI